MGIQEPGLEESDEIGTWAYINIIAERHKPFPASFQLFL